MESTIESALNKAFEDYGKGVARLCAFAQCAGCADGRRFDPGDQSHDGTVPGLHMGCTALGIRRIYPEAFTEHESPEHRQKIERLRKRLTE
jgi:hypothetical protein